MTTAADSFDPRTTLARPDLADQGLEGVVRARVYRAPRPMHCAVAVADIRADIAGDSTLVDQLIFGEAFDVLDMQGDRLWGRARRDGVVGWVDRASLAGGAPLATHRVGSTDAPLPLNALVVEAGEPEGLALIGAFASDPVEVAERLLGVPHRPGARSSQATDCAGLVQQALYACGRAAPRYPDQQVELGEAVDRADARRGDLVIWLHGDLGPWNGHSAFLLADGQVLHATGHHGAVAVEPLAEAEARYAAGGFSAPRFRRL
ncbi:NlpC/P60 family protein [Brevundimonas lenta]|uniref:Cell wall-associated NlpC family hydrolase n=1 Tax=Brevundimonas lenta TaxID=424796 RepID=A0A7W6JB60_9CAUL|nr:NlpC/P60 family protein [Brevundimonas lenta]MBB4081847.1 cell wall-associated NlpC family hydrolase [Brevundimonas lenta]